MVIKCSQREERITGFGEFEKTVQERIQSINNQEEKNLIFIPISHAMHYTAILVNKEAQTIEYINSKSRGEEKIEEYEPSTAIIQEAFFTEGTKVFKTNIFHRAVQQVDNTCGMWILGVLYAKVKQLPIPDSTAALCQLLNGMVLYLSGLGEDIIRDENYGMDIDPTSVVEIVDETENIGSRTSPSASIDLTGSENIDSTALKDFTAHDKLIDEIQAGKESDYFIEGSPSMEEDGFHVINMNGQDNYFTIMAPRNTTGGVPYVFTGNPNKRYRRVTAADQGQVLVTLNRRYLKPKDYPNHRIILTTLKLDGELYDYFGLWIQKTSGEKRKQEEKVKNTKKQKRIGGRKQKPAESRFPELRLVTRKDHGKARTCMGCYKALPDDDGFLRHYSSVYIPNFQADAPRPCFIHLNIVCFTSYIRNQFPERNREISDILKYELVVEDNDLPMLSDESQEFIQEYLKFRQK